MTPSRWREITDLFTAALETTAGERAAFLRDATRDDPDLRREVESLLASHERAGEFLDEPAWAVGADLILPEQPSLTGKTVGPYKIGEEIGRGGMGVVYAASDERLGRTVALKALTPEYTSDRTRRERLTREARAAAALSHPAIATIFALEEFDGELFIASELVRGRTLREELADGPLPAERLWSTLCDVAAGLAAAHERGIVHRDLKPENIVRRPDGQIKILDFGLAHVDPAGGGGKQSRLTQAGIAVGTPGYMAPEQLAGREVDVRADVFAFGVLAWELSTGEHPFGSDASALLARMTEMMDARSAPFSRPLPIGTLDPVVRRCLHVTPSDRFASGAELLHALRAASPGDRRPAPRPSSRHSALWWWQFHQAAIAAVDGAMPAVAWSIRAAVGPPFGPWIFFASLALATIAVTLRLNLLFTLRVHPELMAEQRARVVRALAIVDVLLVIVVFGAATRIAGVNDEAAGLLIALVTISVASLVVIEPATTRAAGLR